MAKKKEPELKNLLNKYFQEFLSFLLTSLEEGTGDLLKKLRDWMNFKKRLQKYVISVIIVVASLAVILYGIGTLLGSFFPGWGPGASHILIGIIAILAGWAYRKYS